MFLSFDRSRSLAKVMCLLAESQSEKSVRVAVGEELLRLLDADYLASYLWDPGSDAFIGRVSINMSESNLSAYEAYYQFRDPITRKLQQCKTATLVEQVLPQDQLMKTEFFNDFLLRDGLYWGVNLFLWDGESNIGDFRIWRKRSRDRFNEETIELLELLRPGFVGALRRCRTELREGAGASEREIVVDAGPSLSARERDVADLVAQGLSDKAIAQKLGIGFPTVRTHVSHIFSKLGIENRVQLVSRLATLSRRPA
jgi:DNA-binding CsgD family transcriptional regulator